MRDQNMVPDPRLPLMFVAAYPAIDAGIRTPLMLSTAPRMDADRIGGAFLILATTHAQRPVGAKWNTKTAAIPSKTPELTEMPERLGPFWEAICLTYLTVHLLPETPEAPGLAALRRFPRPVRLRVRAMFLSNSKTKMQICGINAPLPGRKQYDQEHIMPVTSAVSGRRPPFSPPILPAPTVPRQTGLQMQPSMKLWSKPLSQLAARAGICLWARDGTTAIWQNCRKRCAEFSTLQSSQGILAQSCRWRCRCGPWQGHIALHPSYDMQMA